MTDAERTRLERARATPQYAAAMQREPNDYAVPIALLALFYLIMPALMLLQLIGARTTGDVVAVVVLFFMFALPALPLLWGMARTWPLRKLPPNRVFGLVRGRAATDRRGRWVDLEPLDGPMVTLRLRLKAYLDSTGGAVGAGAIGVALCKGDQMVEWIALPDPPDQATAT